MTPTEAHEALDERSMEEYRGVIERAASERIRALNLEGLSLGPQTIEAVKAALSGLLRDLAAQRGINHDWKVRVSHEDGRLDISFMPPIARYVPVHVVADDP